MENRRRRRVSPFPYLILNILLSTLTTLAVLWLWNRAQAAKMPEQPIIPASVSNSEQEVAVKETPLTLPPLPALDTPVIEIVNIFGAGDLENEELVLQNISPDQEVWLDGWVITTPDGSSFVFQALVLNPNARVQVYSRAGHDSVNKLYWNRSEAAWSSGDQITLTDYEGNSRAVFTIP